MNIRYIVFLVMLAASQMATAVAAPKIQFLTLGHTVTTRYIGDQTVVRVEGLSKGVTYVIRNVFSRPGSPAWEARLVANADEQGVISTDTATPLSGTYTRADADGLFWSQSPSDQGSSLEKGNNFTVEKDGQVIATANLPTSLIKPGIKEIPLDGTGLVGSLYLPASGNRWPVVITYSGSEGGVATSTFTAKALANRGFAALALAYFAAPGLPADLNQIPLEYFGRAIDYLKSRPDIGDIAVMGPSRGGELSLLLGATFQDIKAVVAQVPSPIRWGANIDPGAGAMPSAWTYQGKQLSFAMVVGGLEGRTLPDGRTVYSNRPAFERGLANREAIAAATSEIEKTNGPILMIGGDDDKVWPSCALSSMALSRLTFKGHPFHDQMLCFQQAGHSVVTVPGLPTTQLYIQHPHMKDPNHPETNIWLEMGGTPEGNARGQREAWEKSVEFLRQNLKPGLALN